MLLDFISLTRIKAAFPSAYVERGQAYFYQGRVTQLKHSIEKKGEEIKAQVEGSRDEPYQVRIEIRGQGNKQTLRGFCNCPMIINCKHVIAVLLQAKAAREELGLTHKKETPLPEEDFEEEVSAPNPLSEKGKALTWLTELNLALTPEVDQKPSLDESHCLCYLLNKNFTHPSQLALKLVLARRLKSGVLGTPKTYNPASVSQLKHLYPEDFALLEKLQIANKFAPFHNNMDFPEAEISDKLLSEILQTGRCYWIAPQAPALQQGPVKQAQLTWKIDEKGLQEPQFIIDQASDTYSFFFLGQLWYFNKTQSEMGPSQLDLNPRAIKALLKAPKIPAEQSQDLAKLLKKHGSPKTVPSPQVFSVLAPKKIKPIPCLRLREASLTSFTDNHYYSTQTQTSHALANLSFIYNTKELAWEDKERSFSLIEGNSFLKIKRDWTTELKALKTLQTYDLDLIKEIPNLARLNPKLTSTFIVSYYYEDPLKFTLKIIPLLRKQGWQIELDENYPYQVIEDELDDWYSTIRENESQDWFNLELGVTIKGQQISLLPVLQQLLKNFNPENPQEKNEDYLVKLPNSHYIRLPAERVKNILKILVELHDQSSLQEGNSLKLSKLFAIRLLELEAALGATQLRWFGGENLLKLASRLKEFKGISEVQVPKQFQGQLRPYQKEGLNWLQFLREYELSGILADDMGLGKTVQALAHILVEKTSQRLKQPCLVVAPTSLMFNWQAEAAQFTPSLKVLILHGSQRKQHFSELANYDLILTTYPLLVHDKEELLKHEFYLLILDEAQFIKNSKSRAAQIAQQLKAKHRLCLTGTPMENHLGELWSIFHFMMPGLLGDLKKFNQIFKNPIERENNEERRAHLNRRLAPFLLRRTKEKVAVELPPKTIIIRQAELEDQQRDLYETIRLSMQKKIRQQIAAMGFARSQIYILDALLKLRQVCCDPRLLKTETAQKKTTQSAKLNLLMSLLPELLEEGRRILLFSQFTEMLGLIEAELHKINQPYLKLTGQTKDRATPIRSFQNQEVPLFLISLKAGGTGLNLTAADTVIHYDPWWNPAVEKQATDRAHRIGQDKPVFVYKLVSKGTVEEKILDLQNRKAALMEGLFSEASANEKWGEENLKELFGP